MLSKLRQWAAGFTPSGKRANALMASVRADSVAADPPDARDYEWQDLPSMVLPSSVDLSHFLISIEHQQQTNSCVAQSGTSILEAVKAAIHVREQLSRLHLYWHARSYIGATDQDSGCYLRNACKAMYRVGVAPEAVWPFYEEGVYVQPTYDVDAAAASNKATRYERIASARQIQEALTTGHPVFLAMQLERSFFYLGNVKPHAYAGMSKPGAEYVGNHAMAIVGYIPGHFVIANSWGSGWGQGGYCFLPMSVVITDSQDIWVIREFDGVDVMAAWKERATIARLYVALFGRAPDGEGLSYWVSRLINTTPTQIADEMFNTAPAREFYPSTMTAAEIVRSFYVNVLGREPDDGGLVYWTAKLKANGPGPTITELIAACAEYAGWHPEGIASAQLFADKTAKALAWGESGRGVAGSREAIN
jgi:hypothetical protein